MLFSDALVIGGLISHDEIATRSSIGYYLFSPPGENERLILQAGFTDLKVKDTTEHAARTAGRWLEARGKFKDSCSPLKANKNTSACSDFFPAYIH